MTTTKATQKPANPGAFPALVALLDRHPMHETLAASMLGVPLNTLRKWINGTRAPSASAIKLVELFVLLETVTPDVFASLIPRAEAPMRGRGRPRKLNSESSHVKKSGSNGSTDSIQDPVM